MIAAVGQRGVRIVQSGVHEGEFCLHRFGGRLELLPCQLASGVSIEGPAAGISKLCKMQLGGFQAVLAIVAVRLLVLFFGA